MCAVKLDAPPGMMSGSPMFLFFKPASGSCTISSWFPDVSSLIASPLSTISCSILARHSSGCCPNPAQPGHPAAHPYLTKMFCRKYNLFARWPLANSSLCWIVGPCCVLHNVFSLLLLASTARIHRCGQACRQKLLASTSCSTWLHPQNGFAPSIRLQMAQLLQCSSCSGWNDKAFTRFPSLGKLLTTNAVSHQSAHQNMIRSNFCLVLVETASRNARSCLVPNTLCLSWEN